MTRDFMLRGMELLWRVGVFLGVIMDHADEAEVVNSLFISENKPMHHKWTTYGLDTCLLVTRAVDGKALHSLITSSLIRVSHPASVTTGIPVFFLSIVLSKPDLRILLLKFFDVNRWGAVWTFLRNACAWGLGSYRRISLFDYRSAILMHIAWVPVG